MRKKKKKKERYGNAHWRVKSTAGDALWATGTLFWSPTIMPRTLQFHEQVNSSSHYALGSTELSLLMKPLITSANWRYWDLHSAGTHVMQNNPQLVPSGISNPQGFLEQKVIEPLDSFWNCFFHLLQLSFLTQEVGVTGGFVTGLSLSSFFW